MQNRVAVWLGAFSGFYRPDIAELRRLDVISRFLYAARSVILVISAQAALIAGLLAAADRAFHWTEFMAVLAGFVVAHMISNLSNDYFGFVRGHDKPDSPRMRYTIHPLASGILSRRALWMGCGVLASLGSAVLLYFLVERGGLAAAFAACGISLLLLYDVAPVSIKSLGLGEFAVLLVWGSLMIGGGYAMIAGHVSHDALYASVPYGLGVMSILNGKHIDQRAFDAGQHIGTLPVRMGEAAARRLTRLTIVLMYGLIAALIVLRRLTPFTAVVVLALPRAAHALGVLARPAPATPPAGYTGWPLWYHRACLVHNRLFGWLYILGLSAGAIWPGPGR